MSPPRQQIEPATPAPRPVPKKTLIGVLGGAAAVLVVTMIPREESGRVTQAKVENGQLQVTNVRGNLHQAAYRDVVHIVTICDGDTHNVRMGEVDTPAQCEQRLEDQIIAHAEPVMACAPVLRRFDFQAQLAASVSLAYNIGPGRPGHAGGFCGSTVAREFNAGHWRAACDAFLRFNKAGGRVIAGLDARRRRERAVCLTGL